MGREEVRRKPEEGERVRRGEERGERGKGTEGGRWGRIWGDVRKNQLAADWGMEGGAAGSEKGRSGVWRLRQG